MKKTKVPFPYFFINIKSVEYVAFVSLGLVVEFAVTLNNISKQDNVYKI